MNEERRSGSSEASLNAPDVPVEELGRELTGDQAEGDQVAYVRQGEVDELGSLTDTEIYQGELEAGVHDDLPSEPVAENIESLTDLELRAGETRDPDVAAEEGLAYVPPVDPPVIPDADEPEGIRVAAGFGVTATDEPYDEDHHGELVPEEDEMSERVREALLADAATSRFAEEIAVATRGARVILRGTVDDIEDSDNAVAVADRVSGVIEVVDELEVRALR
jgi:hypothetical protein